MGIATVNFFRFRKICSVEKFEGVEARFGGVELLVNFQDLIDLGAHFHMIGQRR